MLEGRATTTVDGEEHDAPAGTCVLVDVGTMGSAVAAEAGTSVIALGGRPGAALPVSPFEHYYAAQPAYEAGDYDRAVAIAAKAWPTGPTIRSSTTSWRASKRPGAGGSPIARHRLRRRRAHACVGGAGRRPRRAALPARGAVAVRPARRGTPFPR